MKIIAISIQNLRSISNLTIELSDINVFVGQNNSGKSTILNSILQLQGYQIDSSEIRHGKEEFKVIYYFNDLYYYNKNSKIEHFERKYGNVNPCINIVKSRTNTKIEYGQYHDSFRKLDDTETKEILYYPNIEPKNILVPFFSKRKVDKFTEEINSKIVNEVRGNFSNLNSKIDRILSLDNSQGNEFKLLLSEIIGFDIKAFQSLNGKKLGLLIDAYNNIPLDSLGDGVTHLVGFLNELCIAENKIFIIEEPETEIHPRALKQLLNVIREKSKSNQFFISTHSNIVLSYLGGEPNCKVYETKIDYQNSIPSTTVDQLVTIESRIDALRSLGYELVDFYLWDSWIIFEESSAERITREYLIPWFAKKMIGKTRTISVNGKDKVSPSFDDFYSIFCYLHLEKNYFDRAFAIVDKNAREIVESLRIKYTTWNKDNFIVLSEDDFEQYYPDEFKSEVEEVLGFMNRKQKRDGKRKLLEKVLAWIKKDEKKAKSEFQKSAKLVINELTKIEKKLYPN